jgi:two-component system, chemotaxis family, CheB/CheR fusion protein
MTNRPHEPRRADSDESRAVFGAAPPSRVESPMVPLAGTHCPVVGIVASAGGLSAFKHFLESMPTPNGVAIVIVPHLDAIHKSFMVELLSRQTSMPVVEATDGTVVEANHVYVIPPNRVLTIKQGTLRLGDFPIPVETQTAIDIFLRALAVDQGERAVGIVLSGTGTHGTLGIREIKRRGGMTMAQSPDTAEFDQMPRSAIETGLVDFVLSPEQLPEALMKYVQHPYVNSTHGAIHPASDANEDLTSILKLVREQTQYDFRSYRKKMLLRRIERRMGLLQLDDIKEYCHRLQDQPSEVQSLSKDFLIGVTAFFREPGAFAVLEKEVIPAIVSNHSFKNPIRIWVPSCASGEEAYSIAILLFEALTAAGRPLELQVYATDINVDSIQFARRGVYPSSRRMIFTIASQSSCEIPSSFRIRI